MSEVNAKRDLVTRCKNFLYWRLQLPMKRISRLSGAAVRSTQVRDLKIALKIGSDLEQYRLDSYENKEPETISWLDSTFRNDSVLFDIGANVGVYSLYAGMRAPSGKVFSFEPSASNFARLCENIKINGLKNVRPYCVGLSDTSGFDVLHLSNMDAGTAMHSISAPTDSRIGGELSVFEQGIWVVSVSDLVSKYDFPSPTHIKIDVDGNESKIFSGLEGILDTPSLKHILVELIGDESDSVSQASTVITALKGKGFSISDRGAIYPIGSGDTCRNFIFVR